jgi:hypothetical protein
MVLTPSKEWLSADDVRAWRLAHSASQRQAAQAVGVSSRTWWNWENHRYTPPYWARQAMVGASGDLRRLVTQERNQRRQNLRRLRKREHARRQREKRALKRLARDAESEAFQAARAANRVALRDLERRLRRGLLLEEEVTTLGRRRVAELAWLRAERETEARDSA